jgi:hypothetical protein
MNKRWMIKMARTAVQQAEPDEVVALADAVLPALVETLPKPQLKAFIQHLFTQHLSTLLRDLDQADRAELLQAVLPTIADEFPLHKFDLATMLPEQCEG